MNASAIADTKLTIGRFARLTGLSIGALRHYDELDLLRPLDVDRFTGYRRYAADQVEIGRAIARLRDLEVPLEEIRAVLGTDDPAEQRRRVAGQAARVRARVDRPRGPRAHRAGPRLAPDLSREAETGAVKVLAVSHDDEGRRRAGGARPQLSRMHGWA